MRAVIQRVTQASVCVDGKTIGQIEHGILAYIGLGHDDSLETAKKLVDKILTYRIFANAEDKLDKNVQEVGGGLLLVSQFTLMANTRKGRRPDFAPAMSPSEAEALFAELVTYAKTQYTQVATGEFGANMQVSAINDGPINFLLEVE
ncbi:D-aminoacyl-tRNA deacylase [Psychrobacter sp. I-STPA10]|uniref:D-aminoacyl-tRNA deacylase n=1 Tax=Psychrobacter sp. I-STPA10 TaxID=2585769 RepID=UPI001E5AF4DF|nr:D-aminoacyl-tRNA deacylase [Psychrobacter sp. I-STPA10]